MSTLFNYVTHPVYRNTSDLMVFGKLKSTVRIYLWGLLLIAVAAILLVLLDEAVVNIFHGPSIRDNLSKTNDRIENHYQPYQIILIVPFIEELIFRLGLSTQRIAFSISTSLLFFVLTGGSIIDFQLAGDSLFLAGISLSFLLGFYFLIPDTFFERLRSRYFRYYFYFSAFFFGLVHIGNFEPIYWELFYLYPLFVIPHMIMGLLISYTRVNYGFLYGVLLHALFNTPTALL